MGYRLVDELPDQSEIRYISFLYNTPQFLNANNDLPQIHYYWYDPVDNSCDAHVAFNLEEGEAISPFKAPFGGIEFNSQLSSEDLMTFLVFVERELKSNGVRFIRVGQCPEAYQDQRVLTQCLKDLQYNVKSERVFQVIPVSSHDLIMKEMEMRRLRKCNKSGFEFRHLPQNELSRVYTAINDWRNMANKPLSMGRAELDQSRKLNKEAYIPFGIYSNEQLIAATIAIRVNNSILYHFYPAHDPAFNNYSPIVKLVDGMYKWCQNQGVELLDLGTSYVGNKMNQSLYRFKSHIGGMESKGLVFRKALSSR